MTPSPLYSLSALALALIVAALAAVALEVGFRIGEGHRRRVPESASAGSGPIEGAIYALFGLLLAFSFSVAVMHYDTRRALVVQEANDIATAYLRADVAPEPERATLQRLLRDYLDARIAFSLADFRSADVDRWRARGGELRRDIWRVASDLMRRDPHEGHALLAASLNTMFDTRATRLASLDLQLKDSVVLMLAATAALAAATAGYASGLKDDRHPVAWMIFLLLLVLVLNVIFDLDRPRRGLYRVPIGPLLGLQGDVRGEER